MLYDKIGRLELLIKLKHIPVFETHCGSFSKRRAIFKKTFGWLIAKTITFGFKKAASDKMLMLKS